MSTKSIIQRVESQVQNLVADHKRLNGVCQTLKTERDELLQQRRELQQEVKELTHQLSVAQLCNGLGSASANQNEAKNRARARVNQLMREVDRCINLLSAEENAVG